MASPIPIAANLANRAHAAGGQVRKGSGLPYIIHPYRVALLVESAGGTQEQVAAAWAHDVLEDCPAFHDEAQAVLPPAVYALVGELTKPEVAPGKRVKGEAFMAKARCRDVDNGGWCTGPDPIRPACGPHSSLNAQ